MLFSTMRFEQQRPRVYRKNWPQQTECSVRRKDAKWRPGDSKAPIKGSFPLLHLKLDFMKQFDKLLIKSLRRSSFFNSPPSPSEAIYEKS